MTNSAYSLRPNTQRATQALVAFYVVIGTYLALILSCGVELYFLHLIENGTLPDLDLVTVVDKVHAGLSVVVTLCMVVCGVFFIRWFRRAYFNLHQLPLRMKHSESWALWCWLIPFVNLVSPYRLMREMHRKSEHLLRGHPRAEGLLGKYENVNLWWGLWLAYGLLSQILSRVIAGAEGVNELQMSFQLQALSYGFGILTAYVATLVVREYAAIGEALYDVYLREEDQIIDSFGRIAL